VSSLPEGMCQHSAITLAVYNGDHYNTATEAVSYGGMYESASQPSLYGDSGLMDAEDIIDMVQNCLGTAGSLVLCVPNKAGTWVEV